jgi:hypothetical protein
MEITVARTLESVICRDGGEDPEPDDRVERAEAGQSDAQDHVGLPEPVEALRRRAREEDDRQDQQEHRLRADEPAARDRRRPQVAQRTCTFLGRAPPKARLRHRERGEDPVRGGEDPAGDDREPQVGARDRDAQPDPDEGARVAELLAAREYAPDALDADLVDRRCRESLHASSGSGAWTVMLSLRRT